MIFAGCSSARLPISQLLTKTFQPWLIAEDNPLIAVSYEDIVTEAGLSVGGSFLSCESAEKWLSVHNPDLAILDVTLQDGNSAELAKKLCGREIPFLVVSGYSAESEGIDEIFKLAPWLEKPVTSAALESALRALGPALNN